MEVSATNIKLPKVSERNMYVSNRGRKLKPLNYSTSTSKKENSKIVKAADKPADKNSTDVQNVENVENVEKVEKHELLQEPVKDENQNDEIIEEAA